MRNRLVSYLLEDEGEPAPEELVQSVTSFGASDAELAKIAGAPLLHSKVGSATDNGVPVNIKYLYLDPPPQSKGTVAGYKWAQNVLARMEEYLEANCPGLQRVTASFGTGMQNIRYLAVAIVVQGRPVEESDEPDPEHLMRATLNPWEALDDYGFKEQTIPLGLGANWQQHKLYRGANVTVRVFQKHGDFLVMFTDPNLTSPNKYRMVNSQIGTLANDLKMLADSGANPISASHKFTKGSHYDLNDDAGSFWMETMEKLFREFTYKVVKYQMYTFLGKRNVRLQLSSRGFHIIAVGSELEDKAVYDQLRYIDFATALEGYNEMVKFLKKYRWTYP